MKTVFAMKHFFLITLAAMTLIPACAGSAFAEKPNVMLVMTDDQGYGDLACPRQPGHQDAQPRRAPRPESSG